MLPFSIGFGELFVIVVVVLLVVGPAKLPQIARTLGSGVRMARRATRELQDAIHAEELKKPLIKPWEEVVKARDEVMDSILSVEAEVVEQEPDNQQAVQAHDSDHPSASPIAVNPIAGAVAQGDVAPTPSAASDSDPKPGSFQSHEGQGNSDG